MDTAKTDTQQNPDQSNVSWKDTPKPSATASSAPKNKEAGALPTMGESLGESVQVGANKYRIV